MSERMALSSNGFSVDDQTADVLSWLSNSPDVAHREISDRFAVKFPEYNGLTWSGSWVDTDASGVDAEYMSWVRDWIEDNAPVAWEDGEPWLIDGNDDDDDDDTPHEIVTSTLGGQRYCKRCGHGGCED